MNCKLMLCRFFRQIYSSTGAVNLYHLLAILVSWLGVLYLAVVVFSRDDFGFVGLLDYFSAFCSFAGTLWISAGVCYVKPKCSFNTLQELETH